MRPARFPDFPTPLWLTNTKTFELADEGVIVAVKPVSAKVAEDVVAAVE